MKTGVYTLDDLRNWREETIRLGVIGDPVAHSFSPQMQNAALAECGIPLRYARFEVRSAEVAEALERFAQHSFVGLNVTVPHKSAVMQLVGEVYEPAKTIGATNTLFRSGQKWHAFNTDGQGFADAIRDDFGIALSGLRVLILGSGGAARAIAHQCNRDGARAVYMWNRKTTDDPRELAREADLIVNATPVGLSEPRSNVGGLRSPSAVIELGELDPPLLTRGDFRPDQMVFDTIYHPARTQLLVEAAAAGAQTANGLSMLLHQGARAFEIWFGRSAPLDVMQRALERGGPRSPSAADRARRSRSTSDSAADRARRSR